jgi:hypothetical protein
MAVLGTLAATTIAVPLSQAGMAAAARGANVRDAAPEAAPIKAPAGPSTLAVLSEQVAAPAVANGIAAAPLLARDPAAASRSQDRVALPGCETPASTPSANGQLTPAQLCALPFAPGFLLQPRAAVALTALNDAFRAQFGVDVTIDDAYRSLGEQYSIKATRGFLAAPPGKSNHGWGLAIDLKNSTYLNSAKFQWFVKNAGTYGWGHPTWALGIGGPYEPWHWEFMSGVLQVSPDEITYAYSASTK